LPKKAKPNGPSDRRDVEGLRKSLLSIGVDKKSAGKLLGSAVLDRVVVPIYWKDGLELQAHSVWLSKLPSFLKSFEKEFPDGQVRWDSNFYEQKQEGNSSDVAIRVFFNYQEDDDGDHWSPKPNEMEAESYQKMLRRFSYTGTKALQAHIVLHGK
jgi:hypothetical protein